MSKINCSTIGIDLSKNYFQVHAVNEIGKIITQKKLTRTKILEFMANCSQSLVGIEACGSSYYWAREFKKLGHDVKIISPQFVKPYIKSGKNDKNDAEGICEAVSRPNMRFVPLKTVEQQDIQATHRVRSRLVGNRTQLSNEIRGLLAEYGIILTKGHAALKNIPFILEDEKSPLTENGRQLFKELYTEYLEIEKRIELLNKKISNLTKLDARCLKIKKIPGVGDLTASAIVGAIGNGRDFKKGREVSSWLGLVPRQNSTGGKERLGKITKRGDVYLRTLFIHGARSVVRSTTHKEDAFSKNIQKLVQRLGKNKAAVALANKNVRIVWALLALDKEYDKSKTFRL
jgi:transposase